MEARLQKLLAQAGISSRRKAEEIIIAGRVTVNGVVVTELGTKATTGDEILVDGEPIKNKKNKYIMFHKPAGVITTVNDTHGRPTVMDYLPGDIRLFPVGRLDFDTSGLLLLTNDGDWANNISHPKYEIKKTYIAELRGIPSDEKLELFRTGLKIDGRLTAPCEIKRREKFTFQIIIHEGRNRQVRKMCEAIGYPVVNLKRVAIGGLRLGNLPPGKWQSISKNEISNLYSD